MENNFHSNCFNWNRLKNWLWKMTLKLKMVPWKPCLENNEFAVNFESSEDSLLISKLEFS